MTTALVLRRDWERWQRTARQARYLANYAAAYASANETALQIRAAQEAAHALAAACLETGVPMPPEFAVKIRHVSNVALYIEKERRQLHDACKVSRAYIRKWSTV